MDFVEIKINDTFSFFYIIEQNRTEQNRTEQNRTEQNRTEQNGMEWQSMVNGKKKKNE
jgi:hypothetical protein